MRSILISLLITFFLSLITSISSAASISTEPQQIVSITRVLHEKSFYEEQMTLWQQELNEDESNPNAWLNYYLASRTVNMLTPERNPNDLDLIHNELAEKIAGTFEYEYITYLNGGGDATLWPHLQKAYELDPNRIETYGFMINHYLTTGNQDQVNFFCKKWLDSGDISSGILSWNYNALIGLEPNAILLTHGDNDTYPSWILQQVNEVRPDVTVLNVHLLRNRKYCNRSFSTMELPLFPSQNNSEAVWNNDLIPLVDHMMTHSSRPLYFNITLPKKIRESYKEVLYTVGLAFKYSNETFDNVAVLRENYEQKFLLDYLKMGFLEDESATVLNSMNNNYLPAFVTLYKHYIENDEKLKAEEIKKVLLNIARANNKEEKIEALIATPKKWYGELVTHMDIKKIDKQLKELRPGFWASSIETTNEAYEAFLMDLLKSKEYSLLEICKSTKVDWMSLLPENLKHLTEDVVYKTAGVKPDHPLVPVTNISYEAAVIYCDWLTMTYNAYAKKKKHQKVRFRLPTEQEWMMAARANRDQAPYPWGGFYYKNKKGCYLSNFYSSDGEPCKDCEWKSYDNDGGFFPVIADTYFPNDFGLYGMSGNVAEMIEGGQLAKGGSWEDIPEECTITAQKAVDGISPAIGFRVFMEVIK